jgi:hypothetical protein
MHAVYGCVSQLHTFMGFSDLLIAIVLNVDSWTRFVFAHFSVHQYNVEI